MKNKPKVLIGINSDIGRQNSIGARFGHIVDYINTKGEFNLTIIARANYSENFVKTPLFGNLTFRARRALRIFLPKFTKQTGFDKGPEIFDSFLFKKVLNGSFDIAHLQPTTPRTIEYLENKGVKIILDIPMLPPKVPERRKKLMKISSSITAPSKFIEKVIHDSSIKTPTSVIPFGVDSNKFKPINGKDNKVIKFAFVGDIGKRKGADYLLRAWKELELDKSEINFYGRVRDVKKELRRLSKNNIKLNGFVDTSKELPKNHVFILPSLVEGSAKAIYEAMACGLPIITTPNAGSVIRDGEEGFIIPPKDKEAIKEKILYFYNNPEKIEEMGKKARKLAEKYTWERYAKNVYDVYKKVLNEEIKN